MPTALITGIAGQDGYYLAKRLLSEGTEVHGLARPGEDVSALGQQITIHRGDLGERDQVEAIIAKVEPDEIYNLGGISSVAYSWQHPALTGQISGVGAANVFEAARRLQQRTGQPVRVLQASSGEIFGQATQSPQTEQTPIAPMNPYGAAKAYAHQMAHAMRADGLFVATNILYNHESPRRPKTFVTRKITSGVAEIAQAGEGVLALGNLDARRDWGWAPDYVEAMVRTIRYPAPEDFVLATGETHTVGEFVEAAFAQVGIDDWQSHVRIDPAFVRPQEAAVQVGDASKARRLLGWVPTVTFSELVARLMADETEQLAGSVASSG